MIINFDNGFSNLGIRGSYEYFASAAAIVRRYNEETAENDKKSRTSPTCKEIFELSYNGNQVALKVVKENAEMVGVGLANLISIFAPEIIVIGGGMSEANDEYLDLIRKSAFGNSLENCRTNVKIERAHLGSAASLLGSSYYGLTRLAGKSI
jgi:glucokinase